MTVLYFKDFRIGFKVSHDRKVSFQLWHPDVADEYLSREHDRYVTLIEELLLTIEKAEKRIRLFRESER